MYDVILHNSWSPLAAVAVVVIVVVAVSRAEPKPISLNAPKLADSRVPLLGSLAYFWRRRDFWIHEQSRSPTGNFSFWLAGWKVVAVAGEQARVMFFNTAALDLDAGYAALFGQSPQRETLGKKLVQDGGDEMSKNYMRRRITTMLKKERLEKVLSTLINDTNEKLDLLGEEGVTDPFESIYAIVFQLTVRAMACREIADDTKAVERLRKLFEDVESSASMISILFPWFPGPAKIKRTISATRIYLTLDKIVKDRKKENRREDDPLQHLIDEGDSTVQMIEYLLGSLFAGMFNSAINAAYSLLHIAAEPEWHRKVMNEINAVCDKYAPLDAFHPETLVERLSHVPLEAWDNMGGPEGNSFPVVDMCLRETVRLHMQGAMLRRNMSGKPVVIPGTKANESIPDGALSAYHLADVHLNPDVYPDPYTWDPSRFDPAKQTRDMPQCAFLGWGAGRHPCLGMRFAQLEQNVITAFFLARYEFSLVDAQGKHTTTVPPTDRNTHGEAKPSADRRVFIQYRERKT